MSQLGYLLLVLKDRSELNRTSVTPSLSFLSFCAHKIILAVTSQILICPLKSIYPSCGIRKSTLR